MKATPLDNHQMPWVMEAPGKCIINKARQIGISWAETLRQVMDCYERQTKWYYLSVSEERAKEAIEYARIHCDALQIAIKIEDTPIGTGKEKIIYTKSVITFPNGSKIIGLPANARTARGCSGNVCLDEFAHHQDADLIWTAVVPITTRGYHLRVISTPNGKTGRFYKLWTSNEKITPEEITASLAEGKQPIDDSWTRYQYTIHDAIAMAEEHSVFQNLEWEKIKDLCGDTTTWLQEYCCEFLDESSAWLPYDLIAKACSQEATLDFDLSQAGGREFYVGCDVARKRDLFVIWMYEKIGTQRIVKAVVTMQGQKFSVMRETLWRYCQIARRVCIDRTGIGEQLAEETEERFPGIAEGVSITGSTPAVLAAKIKKNLEDGALLIPRDEAIRSDLHQVRRTVTPMGNVRFEASRGKDGHADRFWAAALALHAEAAKPVSLAENTPIWKNRGTGSRDWGVY